MPGRFIQFEKGCYYHIYNRGAARQSIFREDDDYRMLLLRQKEVAFECEVTFVAYSLLPNHYHWLVRQDGEVKAGQVPTRVFGSYSQRFNSKYKRSGTLFEGRYKAILVNSDEYLRQLCRYIHANPVRHGIADAPDLWPYSNYLEWIGVRRGTIVDRQFIHAHFRSVENYKAYVESYLRGQAILPKGLNEYLEQL